MRFEFVPCLNNNSFLKNNQCTNMISKIARDHHNRMICSECEAKEKARETFKRLSAMSELIQEASHEQ